MFSNLRSLIFKLDPEKAHTLAIKSLQFNFVPNLFQDSENDDLFKTILFNKDLKNPIGIAAGFDKNAEVYNQLFKLGFGFVEVGTITPLSQYGNPKPRVFRLVEDEALINRLGFNNCGAKDALKRIKKNPQTGLLGINIGPNKDSQNREQDYLIGLRSFHKVADYITINISSPNTENLRNFHDQIRLDGLLKEIKKEKINLNSKIPIVVKIAPDINNDDVKKISEVLINNGVEAIIISNTSNETRGELKDIHPSAQVKDILIEGSQWFSPDLNHVGHSLIEVKEKYKDYKVKGKRQGYHSRSKFSFDNMVDQLKNIITNNFTEVAKQVELKLPTLKKLELPKLKKLETNE